MVAALYIDPTGCYAGLPDVDCWPASRDARLYGGPHPVVAHPPCARWSVLAGLCEAVHGIPRREDGGCFAAALASVRNYGGVLEHPEGLRSVALVRVVQAVIRWRVVSGGLAWRMDVLRGTAQLRAPCAQEDMALRGRVRIAVAGMGRRTAYRRNSPRRADRRGTCAQRRNGAEQAIARRADSNPESIPRPPPQHGPER